MLTENEFKKLSINFRRVASRLLRCPFDEYQESLAKFLLFIEESPIISKFIEENNTTKFNIKQTLAQREFFGKFKLPIQKSEEIAFIYQLLKYISENELDIGNLSLGYGGASKKIQDHVDGFNQQVVKPFVDYIVTYLEELKIDMGLDGKSGTQFNIGVFEGQLNHAEGNSTITATQTYNGTKITDLKDIVSQYIKALNSDETVPTHEKEDTVEILEAVVQEIESKNPKKVILKTAIEKIKSVGNLIHSGTAIIILGNKLIEKLQDFIS